MPQINKTLKEMSEVKAKQNSRLCFSGSLKKHPLQQLFINSVAIMFNFQYPAKDITSDFNINLLVEQKTS